MGLWPEDRTGRGDRKKPGTICLAGCLGRLGDFPQPWDTREVELPGESSRCLLLWEDVAAPAQQAVGPRGPSLQASSLPSHLLSLGQNQCGPPLAKLPSASSLQDLQRGLCQSSRLEFGPGTSVLVLALPWWLRSVLCAVVFPETSALLGLGSAEPQGSAAGTRRDHLLQSCEGQVTDSKPGPGPASLTPMSASDQAQAGPKLRPSSL